MRIAYVPLFLLLSLTFWDASGCSGSGSGGSSPANQADGGVSGMAGGGGEAGTSERVPVSTEGGQPELLGGRVKFDVPAGALRTGTEITVQRLAPEEGTLVNYQFGPEGLAFERPVRLTLALPAGLSEEERARATIVHIKEGRPPESLATTISGDSVSAQISGFSRYIVIVTPAGCEISAAPPEARVFSQTETSIGIRWDGIDQPGPSTARCGGISGYVLQRVEGLLGVTESSPFADLAVLPLLAFSTTTNERQYVDNTAARCTAYSYRVAAFRWRGSGQQRGPWSRQAGGFTTPNNCPQQANPPGGTPPPGTGTPAPQPPPPPTPQPGQQLYTCRINLDGTTPNHQFSELTAARLPQIQIFGVTPEELANNFTVNVSTMAPEVTNGPGPVRVQWSDDGIFRPGNTQTIQFGQRSNFSIRRTTYNTFRVSAAVTDARGDFGSCTLDLILSN